MLTDMPTGTLVFNRRGLYPEELLRLIEIAHETKEPEIRRAALALLEHQMFPPRMIVPDDLKIPLA